MPPFCVFDGYTTGGRLRLPSAAGLRWYTLTVEVGQGDGLFVIPKVYQITGLRADGYAILLQFQLNLLNGVGRGLCGTTGCRGALYHDADRVERWDPVRRCPQPS